MAKPVKGANATKTTVKTAAQLRKEEEEKRLLEEAAKKAASKNIPVQSADDIRKEQQDVRKVTAADTQKGGSVSSSANKAQNALVANINGTGINAAYTPKGKTAADKAQADVVNRINTGSSLTGREKFKAEQVENYAPKGTKAKTIEVAPATNTQKANERIQRKEKQIDAATPAPVVMLPRTGAEDLQDGDTVYEMEGVRFTLNDLRNQGYTEDQIMKFKSYMGWKYTPQKDKLKQVRIEEKSNTYSPEVAVKNLETKVLGGDYSSDQERNKVQQQYYSALLSAGSDQYVNDALKKAESEIAKLRQAGKDIQFGESYNGTQEEMAQLDEIQNRIAQLNYQVGQLEQIRNSRNTSAVINKIEQNGDAELMRDLANAYQDNISSKRERWANASDYIGGDAYVPYDGDPEYVRLEKEAKKKGYTDEDIATYAQYLLTKDYDNMFGPYLEWIQSHPIAGPIAAGASQVLSSAGRGITRLMTGAAAAETPNAPNVGKVLTDVVKQGNEAAVNGIVDFYSDKNGNPTWYGKSIAKVYQWSTSAVESAALMALAGGATSAIMGMNAAADSYDEALARGLSVKQAAALGITSGVFEALFEWLSLDKIKWFNNAKLTGKKAWAAMLAKSAFVEGSEEVNTDLANLCADFLISGGLSEYNAAMAEGKTPGQFALEKGRELLDSFLGGAFSGGLMGVTSQVTQHGISARNRIAGNIGAGAKVDQYGDVNALIEQGKASGDEKIVKLSKKLEKRIADGKNSAYTKGKLYNLLQTGDVTVAVKQAAIDKGASEKQADAIARGIAAQMTGQIMEPSSETALDTEIGRQIVSEFRGEQSAKWAADLGEKFRERSVIGGTATDRAARAVRNNNRITENRAEINEAVRGGNSYSLIEDGFEGRMGGENGAAVKLGGVVELNGDGMLVVAVDYDAKNGTHAEMVYDPAGAAGTVRSTDVTAEEMYGYAVEFMSGMAGQDAQIGTLYPNDGGMKMSAAAANDMIYVFEPAVNTDTAGYCYFFNDAYKAGRSGVSWGGYLDVVGRDSKAEWADILTETQLREAFRAGQMEFSPAKGVTRIGTARLSDKALNRLSVLDGIMKKLGFSVIAVDTIEDKNGYVSDRADVAVINLLGADRGLFEVAAFHEVLHVVTRELGVRSGRQFVDAVLGVYRETVSSEQYDRDYAKVKKRYGDDLEGLEKEAKDWRIKEELAAQYFAGVATNHMDRFVARLEQGGSELLAKVREALKAFADELKKALNRLAGLDPATAAALRTEAAQAERIFDLFEEAARQAEEVREQRLAEQGGTLKQQAEKGQIGERSAESGEKNSRKAEYEKPINLNDINNLQKQFPDIKSVNSFTEQDLKKTEKWAYKYYQQMDIRSPFFRAWMDWRQFDTKHTARVVSFEYGETGKINYNTRQVYNSDSKFKIKIDNNVIGDSLHYATVNGNKKQIARLLSRIDEITKKAILLETKTTQSQKGNNKKGSTVFMHYLYCPVSVNGAPFLAKLIVEEYDVDGKTRAYNLREIKMSNLQRAQFSQMLVENRGIYALQNDALTVSQLYDFVKTYDKEFTTGREVSPEVLNENGTPKVFYHGSDERFTVFDRKKIGKNFWQSGDSEHGGFFFTTDRAFAERNYGKEIYPVYLHVENPLVIEASDVFYNSADYWDFHSESLRYELFSRIDEDWNELEQSEHDAIIIKHDKDTLVVVRDPNQIKSAETGTERENVGTFSRYDNDIRYSRKAEDVRGKFDAAVAGRDELKKMLDETTVLLRKAQKELREIKQAAGEQQPGNLLLPKREDVLRVVKKYNDEQATKQTDEAFADNIMQAFADLSEHGFGADELVHYLWGAMFDKAQMAVETSDNDTLTAIREAAGGKTYAVADETLEALAEATGGNKTWFANELRRTYGFSITPESKAGQNAEGFDTVSKKITDAAGNLFDGTEEEPLARQGDVYGVLLGLYQTGDSLAPVVSTAYETEDDVFAAAMIEAAEMADELIRVTPIRTMADRYEGKMEELREQYKGEIERRDIVIRESAERIQELNKEAKQTNRKAKARKRYYIKQREKMMERQRDTRERAKVLKSIENRVKWFTDRQTKPSQQKHIPLGLQESIMPIVDYFLTDAKARREKKDLVPKEEEPVVDYWQGDYQKYKAEEKERKQGIYTAAQIDRLLKWYEKLNDQAYDAEDADSSTRQYFGLYNAVLQEKLLGLSEIVSNRERYEAGLSERESKLLTGGTADDRLSLEELKSVRDILKAVQHLVLEADSMFVQGKRVNYTEAGTRMWQYAQDQSKDGRVAEFKKKVMNGLLGVEMLKPIYLFNEVIGGEMRQYFDDIREAQNRYAFRLRDAEQALLALDKQHHRQEWFRKTDTFTLDSGDRVTLDKDAVMQLYATRRRETQGVTETNHLLGGGIELSDELMDLQKKTDRQQWENLKKKTDLTLTLDDLTRIMATLTDEQKAFADAVVKFMSTTCSAWGNEVSRELAGFDNFTEPYYFPYAVSGNYLYQKIGQQQDIRLKNIGFTHALTNNAAKTIALTGFMDIAGKHIGAMASYSTLTIPLENLQRVRNFTPEGEKASVNKVIQNTYGDGVAHYIQNFLNDANGNVRRTDSAVILSKAMGVFKRSAVALNASVVIQQPSAVARAMAMVDPIYFVRSTANFFSYKELMKYSGVAIIKELGGWDINTGRSAIDFLTHNNGRTRLERFNNRADKVTGYFAGKADAITWSHIWNAVKRETAHEMGIKYRRKGMSEEFYQRAAARFNEVADYTQVYDSTISRSQIMRNQNDLVKMATAFMAEPTTSYNLLVFSGMKKNGKTINKGAALGAFLCNVVLNTALQSLVGAWRDKKDESYLERWFRHLIEGIFGTRENLFTDSEFNIFNMIPSIKDFISLFQGYDVGRSDMQPINEMWKPMKKLIDAYKDREDDEALFDFMKANSELLLSFGVTLTNFTHIPLKSLYRDVWQGGKNAAEHLRDGDFHTTAQHIADIWKQNFEGEWDKNEQLYYAVLQGDKELLDRYTKVTRADIEKYITKETDELEAKEYAILQKEKDMHDRISKALMQVDERIRKAAELTYAGDVERADKLAEAVAADGFSLSDVYHAVNLTFKELYPEETEYKGELKEYELVTNDMLDKAFYDDMPHTVIQMRDRLIEQGKAASTVDTHIGDLIDDDYAIGEINLADAKRMYKDFTNLSDKKITERLSKAAAELHGNDEDVNYDTLRGVYKDIGVAEEDIAKNLGEAVVADYQDGKFSSKSAAVNEYMRLTGETDRDIASMQFDYADAKAKDDNYPLTYSNYKKYVESGLINTGVSADQYDKFLNATNNIDGNTTSAGWENYAARTAGLKNNQKYTAKQWHYVQAIDETFDTVEQKDAAYRAVAASENWKLTKLPLAPWH